MNTLFSNNNLFGRLSHVIVLLAMSSGAAFAGVIYAEPLAAKEMDMGNVLTWSTASEESSDYFAIFKSDDGLQFEQIGETRAVGNNVGKMDYRFLDTTTGSMRTFYKLLQVDVDGTQSYTHISVVNKTKPNNFMVTMMGSTVTDRYFNVVFKSELSGHMTYRLINFKKEVTKRGVITIDGGQNLFTLDMENVAAGEYHFEFEMNEEIESLVIVKSGGDVMAKKK
ncbi:MAG: hypothetical protein AB8F74_03750 [Saprospiraceae bacterium]